MLPVLSWGSRADFPVRFGRWRLPDELVVFVAELMPSTGPLWTVVMQFNFQPPMIVSTTAGAEPASARPLPNGRSPYGSKTQMWPM